MIRTNGRGMRPIALLATVAVLGGCGSGGGERAPTLTGAGATFPMPLISLWSSEYELMTGGRVNYNSIGSGGGIRAHTDKTVDFAASEAPLSLEQFAAAPRTLTLPFTIGTVTLAYNLPGDPALQLTGEIVAGIFLGQITRWNDPLIVEVNPGVALPDQALVPVHRSDGSGTTYVFTDYLSKVSPEWQQRVGFATSVAWPTGIGGNGNEGVAGAIRNNPHAIGYIELSYASNLGMTTAAIRNREGHFIRPSLEAGTAAATSTVNALPPGEAAWNEVSFTDAAGADAYPISSFSYFLVYQDLGQAGGQMTIERARAIVQWLEWAVTEGQAYNNAVSNAAIPEGVRAHNLRTLDRMTFSGEPLRNP